VGRPQDTPHYVATSLDQLKKKGRAINPSHGQWVLARTGA
jgi:hypothetical protein